MLGPASIPGLNHMSIEPETFSQQFGVIVDNGGPNGELKLGWVLAELSQGLSGFENTDAVNCIVVLPKAWVAGSMINLQNLCSEFGAKNCPGSGQCQEIVS